MMNGPLSSDLDLLEEAGKYDRVLAGLFPIARLRKVRREVPDLGFHAVLVPPPAPPSIGNGGGGTRFTC